MPVKTKEVSKKVTKSISDKELMHQTITNLTDVVSRLKEDVARIKIRLGIWVSRIKRN